MRDKPFFVPCFSLFSVLELRRRAAVYDRFLELFDQIPCLVMKSHEQLLEQEVHSYPDPSRVDPILTAFAGHAVDPQVRLATLLPLLFRDSTTLSREGAWLRGRDSIVEGISGLVSNFPPRGDNYTRTEVSTFVQIASFEQLAVRAWDFVDERIRCNDAVDIDAFPSVKATAYTVWHKFYVDRNRASSTSDAFDIIIAAVCPYVDAIFTERHQADCLHRTKALDDFIENLDVYTIRALRDSGPHAVSPREK